MTSYTRRCVVWLGLLALGGMLPSTVGSSAAAAEPVQVFILAGQSNMEGKAKVSLLEYQAKQPETQALFQHLRSGDGWRVREDVWIKFLDRKGNLTVGFGSPDRIGPELEFGYCMGDHYQQQVLLIKTAWGGKSLYRDFRPPSSGLPAQSVLEQLLENQRKQNSDTTLDEIKQSFGAYYRAMLDEINTTLGDLDTPFPDYDGRGYEIAGFVWFQGWNDMVNPEYTAEYTTNMVNFIRDVRKDLSVPELPFVIGQLGVGGTDQGKTNPNLQAFKDAQAAAAELPEFAGNVAVVRTDELWDMEADAVFNKGWRDHLEEWEKVGSDYPYHYLGSAKAYSRMGKAFGQVMLRLRADRP